MGRRAELRALGGVGGGDDARGLRWAGIFERHVVPHAHHPRHTPDGVGCRCDWLEPGLLVPLAAAVRAAEKVSDVGKDDARDTVLGAVHVHHGGAFKERGLGLGRRPQVDDRGRRRPHPLQ
jgi:hypothetical protein